MNAQQDIVLAFSGGLDTSFCVPYLQERGYAVHTVFADTGGVDAEERAYIEQRAAELGVASHVTVDGGPAIWDGFVKPFVWAGEGYQGQYPLLVSDRYLIVEAALARCDELGTQLDRARLHRHGQRPGALRPGGEGARRLRRSSRRSARSRRSTPQVRAYEQKYLEERGFGVRAKQKAYTINENLLGLTMSGGEIDRWEAPGEGARGWCAPRAEWPAAAAARRRSASSRARRSRSTARRMPGARAAGAGSTRLFAPTASAAASTPATRPSASRAASSSKRPGLTALLAAHRALEEAVLTKQQNRFKPDVARKWVELVYEGFFHDPLKTDLEAFLASSAALRQRRGRARDAAAAASTRSRCARRTSSTPRARPTRSRPTGASRRPKASSSCSA